MKDHELKVKHVGNGKEFVISKAHYMENPKEWEVLEGDAPELAEPAPFKAPKAPGKPKVTDNPKVTGEKQDKGAEANKMAEGATANKAISGSAKGASAQLDPSTPAKPSTPPAK